MGSSLDGLSLPPEWSDKFEMRMHPIKKRSVHARQAFAAGDTLFETRPPFAVVGNSDILTRCFHCLKPTSPERELKRCSSCQLARFCGPACVKAGWTPEGHKYECAAFKRCGFKDTPASLAKLPLTEARLLARMIWAQKHDPSQHRYDLHGDVDCFDNKEKALWARRIQEASVLVGQSLFNEVLGNAKAALLQMAKVQMNAHTLCTPFGEACGVSLSSSFALINHSCAPNTFAMSSHWPDEKPKYLRVAACRPIKAGDEITIAYVDVEEENLQRRQTIKATYGFDCDCRLCEAATRGEPWAHSNRALRCVVCEVRKDFSYMAERFGDAKWAYLQEQRPAPNVKSILVYCPAGHSFRTEFLEMYRQIAAVKSASSDTPIRQGEPWSAEYTILSRSMLPCAVALRQYVCKRLEARIKEPMVGPAFMGWQPLVFDPVVQAYKVYMIGRQLSPHPSTLFQEMCLGSQICMAMHAALDQAHTLMALKGVDERHKYAQYWQQLRDQCRETLTVAHTVWRADGGHIATEIRRILQVAEQAWQHLAFTRYQERTTGIGNNNNL
ncbi:uncharacterized protein L969DRAFT_83907 [Mixia osmundae IAM 14324]|uniref:SET domain-containing protein n=1 Tax=Mixia osmundae (strain CBS 9802 / IAM 14324 / JCM 22182 / KY 12970) TaxID=764103 RepID=G7DVB9_MIXOS|nr:uncharacterized protein L969DRAFT_83907 [Mixia osmundae IAM 14324]KEI42050.1 hypothetical protein L969DRAFT_83907 [Mixia osmundae IAM 14324]GAA94529.1 hypothetical protein E5Q_01181 [Mixia osmundae IAM 14324]